MSALHKVEQDFQRCMLENSLEMAGQVVGDAQASAEERVRVYVEGYRLRLLEVLEDNFDGLHALVGDEEFERLGRAYIAAHPSTHPSVRWFSQHLPAFLRRTEPYAAHPYLAEMAAFEWCQGRVFDATDDAALGLEALATLPPESWAAARFTLRAAVQRLDLHWNIPAVWQALEAEQTPPGLERGGTLQGWVLWRQDLNTHWRSLGEDEAWALDAVREGRNFAELCEGLCQWHEETAVALAAASLLKRWLTDGLVNSVQTD